MGKKGKWLGAVKKVFSPESKEKKEEKLRKKLAARDPSPPDLTPSTSLEVNVSMPPPLPPPAVPSPHQTEEVQVRDVELEQEQEQSKHVTVEAAPDAPAQTSSALPPGVSREELAAIKIQLLLKQELDSLRMGEHWDDTTQSKEKIEASLISRQEAAIRRERALAYAFSHQWKSSSRSSNPMFVDPNNPHWGWSWLERWMAAKPSEAGRTGTGKESNIDQGSVKSTSLNLGEGEITKAFNRRGSKPDKSSPTTPKLTRPASRLSPSTPTAKVTPIVVKKKPATPKNGISQVDDDARSVLSVQSERPRRHSIATSTVRDDESLASSPSVPSYMAATKSARAKSRLQGSPLIDSAETTPEKGGSISVGSAKKRLSFPAGGVPPSPMRRHSGPPKVESVVKDIAVTPQPEALAISG
ncbi:unnamed protein product [Triticum turgidum subsp. durum]|uniref:DUF4005 domain-containing protein n=1 Tax=Triticum turgidum subsp. durum TaxID=4567 RepID=A0A9R0UKG6_TRITD|nr:unnamed protein product [Triticum turgidum subsp. durum]